MKKLVLGLDCDGVLADFVSLWLEHYNAYPPTDQWPRMEAEDIHTWDLDEYMRGEPVRQETIWKDICAEGIHRRLKPYPGAVEAVASIKAIPHVELNVVTAPMRHSKTWVYERGLWLEEHFGIDHHQIHQISNKARFHGHILVDDRVKNVEDFEAEHPHRFGVVWAHPYNEGFTGLRVSSWGHLLRLLRSLKPL